MHSGAANIPPVSANLPARDLRTAAIERRTQISAQRISSDLGISQREGEIAVLLGAGYDLKGIAARLNISIHTARTHIKAAFAKTGLRSQTELVHRIAKGPASVHIVH
jgi:DNA-binding CsgD family transcriptional regulator